MEETVLNLQKKFDQAELDADLKTLEELIGEDFLSIGPKGFVMNKKEWIGRHIHFKYLELNISETSIRLYDKTVIIINVQKNKATWKNQEVNVATRVTQVWINQDGLWQLVSIQFSPLVEA